MKKLYNTLTEVLTDFGFDIAPWGEDTIQDEGRTLKLDLLEQSQVASSFDVYEATMNVIFLTGDWSSNAAKLSDALMSFIPMEDRVDEESRKLPDNSNKITILEVPQFSEIAVEINEETAEEEHTVSVTLFYS